MNYLFVLGRDPELSLLELESYFESNNIEYKIFDYTKEIALISLPKLDFNQLIKEIGGTIKIAEVFSDSENLGKLEFAFNNLNINIEEKLDYAVSCYNSTLFDFVRNLIKERAKNERVKAFYKKPKRKEDKFLTPSELIHKKIVEKGIDIVIFKNNIARTIAVFNPFDIQQRDLNRPKNDFLKNTSIRLAKILVNLSGVKKNGLILDPFCGCYDDKTEILTEDGWKFFKNVTKKDKIATLNKSTNKLKYQIPKRIFHYLYKGKMYCVKSKQVDLLVTPNHNMFVAKRDSLNTKINWKFTLSPAEQIFGKHVIYKKNCKWEGKEKQYFELGNKKIPMDEWLYFFGLWLAEGSVTKYKQKTGYAYIIQIRNMDNKILKRVFKCLKTMEFNPMLTLNQKVRVFNKELYNYLSQFGKSYEKFIPNKIKSLSSRQLKILLYAYLQGDGYSYIGKNQKNPVIRYWTSSKLLRNDIQEIALKIGWSANYTLSTKKGEKRNKIESRQIIAKHNNWMLTFIQKQNSPRIYKKRSEWEFSNMTEKWVNYKGDIWCVEVPNHIIYVRRDGKPVWCGNSGVILQEALLNKINVIGVDLDDKSISETNENINWLKKSYNITNESKIKKGDSKDLSKILNKKIDAIVTEPYMGPFLKKPPSRREVNYIIKELIPIYESFFREIPKILNKNGRIIIVMPEFNDFLIDPLTLTEIFRLYEPRLNIVLPIPYILKNSRIKRYIYILELK